jgi:hypothetical protein
MFDSVTLVWSAVGAGALYCLFVFARSRRRTSDETALGMVSDQWLAEQRLGRSDSQR